MQMSTEAHEEATHTCNETQHGGKGSSRFVEYKWWMKIALFTIFVFSGQAVATMLGKIYFNKGGNSKWMASLVQTAGFPLMFPLNLMYLPSKQQQQQQQYCTTKPSFITLVMLYMFLGIFLAADCMLYTFGYNFLPLSTFALICASQLAFNAFFSYFLNGQKITPLIGNCLILLGLSSALLLFQNDSEQTVKISRSKYIVGFVCTVAASAGYGLMLSTTQFAFEKILKSQSYKVMYDMIVYQCMIASVVLVVGLFASGEWKDIRGEMEGYKSGKVSYVMNLVWTTVSWQVFTIGCVGLIFEVTSLFSNVISALAIPIAPIFAVVFLDEKMSGVKIFHQDKSTRPSIAMVTIQSTQITSRKRMSLQKDSWNKLEIVLKEKFGIYLNQKQMSMPNTHVNVDVDEDEAEEHDIASDREYMSKLRDEIVE
ncbi:hypothetical protein QVD17_36035 [Tagetes erecta]|uniref:Probable purine permease n=1 Tax=Tagetes erecta TaxID=13708 RepID=A0AAD8JRN5_TARER|nr:hypothetical protein QVD17_36035 [Tagetes erecta]